MAIYSGIQLPDMGGIDDRKERQQILNYLAMLDEKLRYMFQNIDPEENYTPSAFQNYIKTEKGLTSLQVEQGKISSLVSDLEGNFSLLEQTVNGISSTVADMEGNISILEQTTNGIKSTVANIDGELSMVSQEADKINWIVASGTSASNFTLTSRMASLVADEIDVTGFVTFNDLERSGKTTINGDNITTGQILADYIALGGLMTVYEDSYNTKYEGGYIGYGRGDDGEGRTYGILMTDATESSLFIATDRGARMTNGNSAVYCTSSDVVFTTGIDYYVTDLNFYCGTDGVSRLGTSSRLWREVYAEVGTINTSDRRRKNSITYDLTKYEKFFLALKPTPYKMNNGTSGRFHIGFIAQDIEDNLAANGLTSLDFAGFIKSPEYSEVTRSGVPLEGAEIVDYRYALRYGEFVALNTYMIQQLYKRVEALEGKA